MNDIDWVLPPTCYSCHSSPARNIYENAEGEYLLVCNKCRRGMAIDLDTIDPYDCDRFKLYTSLDEVLKSDIGIRRHRYWLTVVDRDDRNW